MQHQDDYPYPDFARAQASFAQALEIVTGRSTLPLACKVKTLHTVVSFAMGMALPMDHDAMTGLAEDESLQALAAWGSADESEGVRGINWKGLLTKLIPLILALLADSE